MGCRIVGCGKALPRRAVTNDELSTIVDTDDEWIRTRTGIRTRHVAVGESATDLAASAGARALSHAGIGADEIDLIVCMTITPDAVIPSQACLVKARLGLSRAVAFDLNAACTGCIYGIEVASSMLEASAADAARASRRAGRTTRNRMRRALVVGVDVLSRIVDWSDRATCVLFGDGAGAVVLEWDDDAPGIMASVLENTDDKDLLLSCGNLHVASGSPFSSPGGEKPKPVDPYIRMQGQRVFKFASASMASAIEEVVARAGVALDDVSLIVAHQANERIIRYAAKKIGRPLDLFQVSIAEVGNTSASSVLMALCDAWLAGRVAPGDKVVLVGFGGGLCAGAVLFEA